jgi:hypothetical protein
MKPQSLWIATLAAMLSTPAFPANAADSRLLSLVMPNAKVLAGVNVGQAKASPFGQYLLGLIHTSQDQRWQELTNQTGFDPTRDVSEVLLASTGTPGERSGLLLATGYFDPAKILAAAAQHGAATETYGGLTILKDPKGLNGIAFLSSSIVVAGDLANVKGAIDRRQTPAALPSTLTVQVNQWSGSQDAWAVSLIPTSAVPAPKGAPQLPGLGPQSDTVFRSIQQAAGGVKFGNQVTVTAQAQADTAQNAQAMGDALKLLASLAQMHSQNNAALRAVLATLTIAPQGNLLNVSFSVPEDQIQQLVRPRAQPSSRTERRM